MNKYSKFYNEIIRDIKNGDVILPVLPDVAVKALSLIEKDEATAKDLADIVNIEPVIAARLLKAVNSPLYRGRVEIGTVSAAVSRLGQKTTAGLITGLAVSDLFIARDPVIKGLFESIWKKSLEVSILCRAVASMVDVDVEMASLLGLVHAVGSLPVIVRAASDKELMSNEGEVVVMLEACQDKIGGRIASFWNLPQAISNAVTNQLKISHQRDGTADLTDVLQIALKCYSIEDVTQLTTEDIKGNAAFTRLGFTSNEKLADLSDACTNAFPAN